MLDVDGTIMPIKVDALPSEKVTQAINKASKLLHVGLVTARPYHMTSYLFNHLKLSGYSIVNGGAEIFDATSKKIVWEKPIRHKDVIEVCRLLKKNTKKSFWVNDGTTDVLLPKNQIPQKVFQIYVGELTHRQADSYISQLSHIPTINLHKTISFKKNYVDLLINHALATKQHGIFEVAKLLNIDTHDIIGVGDNYNDFPLLMACGLKVAMGNAVEDLKAIADYIAPTVEQDGVADVIEKFVLES